jgi:clathrin heavy chain
LIEFRRISGHIYQKNHRWKQAVELAKRDGLFKDAMEACAQSGDAELAESLLKYFIDEHKKEEFAASLYTCYDLLRPDVVFELAWMHGLMDYVVPYMIQFMRDYAGKVDALLADKKDRNTEKVEAEKEAVKEQMNQNLYAQLLPAALPAPPMPGMDQSAAMNGGYQQNKGSPTMPMPGMGMPPMGGY